MGVNWPWVMKVFLKREHYLSYFWALKMEYLYPSYVLEQPFLVLAWCVLGALVVVPLAFGLKETMPAGGVMAQRQSIGSALREAFGYRSFQWLMAGYFVCGFQVVFIGVHLPSYLKDNAMGPHVAVISLALIGLFIVLIGTLVLMGLRCHNVYGRLICLGAAVTLSFSHEHTVLLQG